MNSNAAELLYLADQQAHARARYSEDDTGLIRESKVIEWTLRQAALRASAAPEEGMNHRTTAEPDLGSGHRSAEDAAALACSGCAGITHTHTCCDPSKGPQLMKQATNEQKLDSIYGPGAWARALRLINDLGPASRRDNWWATDGPYEIIAQHFVAASTVVDHQSDNSEPQEAVVNSALAPATEDGGRDSRSMAVGQVLDWLRNRPGISWQATINDIEKAVADIAIRALSPSPSVGTGTVAGQHLSWLFQYMQCMNERNWRDMRDNAIRQLEQLSLMFPGRAGVAQPSADRMCPACGRSIDGPTHAAYCSVSSTNGNTP